MGYVSMSDTGTTQTRLPACPVRNQPKKKYFLIATREGHGMDTVMTQSLHWKDTAEQNI